MHERFWSKVRIADPTYLADNLRQMVHNAMGNGTITGESSAEVEEHHLSVLKLVEI